ncbi:MAG: hypothetical protein ACLQLH_12575 [Terracidiphilus sp.]
MKDLLFKTWNLFRKHPILWVPYIAAELLAIGLWRLRGLAEKEIFRWFTTRHSALGDFVTPNLDHATLAKASLAYAPVGFVTMFIVVFLFVIAMVATAQMVNAVARDQRPELNKSLNGIASRWPEILKFAFKFLFTWLLLFSVTVWILAVLVNEMHQSELPTSLWVSSIEAIFITFCMARFLTPAVIRLLRSPNLEPVSVMVRRLGTILALLVISIEGLLGIITQPVDARLMIDIPAVREAVILLTKLAVNIPYVLLFIGLALLAVNFSGVGKSED